MTHRLGWDLCILAVLGRWLLCSGDCLLRFHCTKEGNIIINRGEGRRLLGGLLDKGEGLRLLGLGEIIRGRITAYNYRG